MVLAPNPCQRDAGLGARAIQNCPPALAEKRSSPLSHPFEQRRSVGQPLYNRCAQKRRFHVQILSGTRQHVLKTRKQRYNANPGDESNLSCER